MALGPLTITLHADATGVDTAFDSLHWHLNRLALAWLLLTLRGFLASL